MKRFEVKYVEAVGGELETEYSVGLEGSYGEDPPEVGTELYAPTPWSAVDSIFGVPLDDVFSLLLDTGGWVEVKDVSIDLIPGAVKTITARIPKNAHPKTLKALGETRDFTVPATRIVAVGRYEQPGATRRPVTFDLTTVVGGSPEPISVSTADLVADVIRAALGEHGVSGDYDRWTMRTEGGKPLNVAKSLASVGILDGLKPVFLDPEAGGGG